MFTDYDLTPRPFKLCVIFDEPKATLCDGHIYVVSGSESPLLGSIKLTVSKLKATRDCSSQVYDYIVENVDPALLSECSELRNAINEGANAIIPLFSYSRTKAQYAVFKLHDDSLDHEISNMMMEVERHTQQEFEDIIHTLALEHGDVCSEVLNAIIPIEEEKYNDTLRLTDDDSDDDDSLSGLLNNIRSVLGGAITSFFSPGFYSIMPSLGLPERTTTDVSQTSYNLQKRAIDNFADNYRFVMEHKDDSDISGDVKRDYKNKYKEVEYVNKMLAKKALTSLNDKIKTMGISEATQQCIDRVYMASRSKVTISIKKRSKTFNESNGSRKLCSDGEYLIFMSGKINGEQVQKQVQFKSRSACTLYALYLIDRKLHRPKRRFIDLLENKALFTTTFRIIYHGHSAGNYAKSVDTEAENVYYELVEKGRLSDCLNTIKTVINDVAREFGEESFHMYIPNSSSHLAIIQSRIDISELTNCKKINIELAAFSEK